MRRIILLGAACALLGAAASAQDYGLEPTYGEIDLSAGFTPDPHTVQVTASGSRDARDLGGDCRGSIANAPDYRLNYSAGTFDLTISVDSESDTTLVVNGPGGAWFCDDDGGEGLNPRLDFSDPASGQYDIWVGSYSEGDYASATLSISELGMTGSAAAGGGMPDYTLPAAFGEVDLSSGHAPYTVDIISGGGIQASNVQSDCRGYIAEAPDFELSYDAGAGSLILEAESDSDTTLVVNAPDGSWYCDDDGGDGLNPRLVFSAPGSGVYDIWVGSYSSGGNADATLRITSPRK